MLVTGSSISLINLRRVYLIKLSVASVATPTPANISPTALDDFCDGFATMMEEYAAMG